MKQGFEEKLMEIQSGLISLCMELTQGKVDKIYAYASIEKKSSSFNAFFEKDGEVLTIKQLKEKIKIDNNTSINFLRIGTSDLGKVRTLCEQYEAPAPTEIKMYYDVKTHKYNADCKYEEICSEDNDLTAGTVFMSWVEEIRTQKENEVLSGNDKKKRNLFSALTGKGRNSKM